MRPDNRLSMICVSYLWVFRKRGLDLGVLRRAGIVGVRCKALRDARGLEIDVIV